MKAALIFFLTGVFLISAAASPKKVENTGDRTRHALLKTKQHSNNTRHFTTQFPLKTAVADTNKYPFQNKLVLNSDQDLANLRATTCEFEDDVNAMVIYDIATMWCDDRGITMERHKRIKIFNKKGVDHATIAIAYTDQYGPEKILRLEGTTTNLNNGKIERVALDPKLIYHEHPDKQHGVLKFSMPDVKEGSVIDVDYIWQRAISRNIPGWSFQTDIPTRQSVFSLIVAPGLSFSSLLRTTIPVRDSVLFYGSAHLWQTVRVPSFKNEPFMRSVADGLQSLLLVLSSASYDGHVVDVANSWTTVGMQIAGDDNINNKFDQTLHDEDDLVKKAKKLKTDDDKVAFLFGEVKTQMKWNEEKNWISKDGIKSAWQKKTGNWGEINMILNRLLNKSAVKAYPMLVSTRDNGRMLNNFVNIYQINKLVTYVPADSGKYYVLDATSKFNVYNEIPFDIINSNGLYIDKEHNKFDLIFLKNELQVKQQVAITADIKPDGSMNGTAEITSFSYNKSAIQQLYNQLDEKKYEEYLRDHNNNLRIISLKRQNNEVDSLPLIQDIDFKLDLPETTDKYIYFNPNLFTNLYNNPFIAERRSADIDFGYNNLFSITGRYKMPQGYKVEVLPKSMTIVMTDKSISFKRIVVEDEGYITVYYVINYKRSFFNLEEYPGLYAYFKKMIEMLNEQIVLVKI